MRLRWFGHAYVAFTDFPALRANALRTHLSDHAIPPPTLDIMRGWRHRLTCASLVRCTAIAWHLGSLRTLTTTAYHSLLHTACHYAAPAYVTLLLAFTGMRTRYRQPLTRGTPLSLNVTTFFHYSYH